MNITIRNYLHSTSKCDPRDIYYGLSRTVWIYPKSGIAPLYASASFHATSFHKPRLPTFTIKSPNGSHASTSYHKRKRQFTPARLTDHSRSRNIVSHGTSTFASSPLRFHLLFFSLPFFASDLRCFVISILSRRFEELLEFGAGE